MRWITRSLVHSDRIACEIEPSIKTASQALSLAQLLGDKKMMAEQQMLLAFNYRDKGEPEKARKYCQAAIQTFESLGYQQMLEKSRLFLAELKEQVYRTGNRVKFINKQNSPDPGGVNACQTGWLIYGLICMD